MHKRISSKLSFLFMLGLVFLAGWIVGQNRATTEKTTIHAVAWTAAKEATEQGFEDLNKATEELVNAMPGLVLEFDNVKSREAYSDHPSRVPWADAWSKVRVPRSTNFDVIGE